MRERSQSSVFLENLLQSHLFLQHVKLIFPNLPDCHDCPLPDTMTDYPSENGKTCFTIPNKATLEVRIANSLTFYLYDVTQHSNTLSTICRKKKYLSVICLWNIPAWHSSTSLKVRETSLWSTLVNQEAAIMSTKTTSCV